MSGLKFDRNLVFMREIFTYFHVKFWQRGENRIDCTHAAVFFDPLNFDFYGNFKCAILLCRRIRRTLCRKSPQNWWASQRSSRRSRREFRTELGVSQGDFSDRSPRRSASHLARLNRHLQEPVFVGTPWKSLNAKRERGRRRERFNIILHENKICKSNITVWRIVTRNTLFTFLLREML